MAQRRRSCGRPAAAGDPEADRPQGLEPLHRRADARGRVPRRAQAERGGEDGHDRRARRAHRRAPSRRARSSTSTTTVFDTIERNGLDSNVSIKLTALGLTIDRGLCLENAEEVVKHAAESGNFVRIDMEESTHTTQTLEHLPGVARPRVRQRRRRPPVASPPDAQGHPLARRPAAERPAVQGHLPRAAPDRVPGLPGGTRQLRRRARPAARRRLVRRHRDPRRVADRAGPASASRGWSREEYEFQMLLGVRGLRGDKLVREGHRLRIYTPYGTAMARVLACAACRRIRRSPGYILADLLGVNGQ